MPMAEAQSEWVADLLAGAAALPPPARCGRRSSARTLACEALCESKRHTIQVDFHPYMRVLSRERSRARGGGIGRILVGRSHELKLRT